MVGWEGFWEVVRWFVEGRRSGDDGVEGVLDFDILSLKNLV